MKIIIDDIGVGLKVSAVIGLLSVLFWFGLTNLLTEVEEFHYVVSLKTWIIFILLIILATAIGWVFLRSINVTKKTPSRAVTLLMSFLWGLAHMVAALGVFVVIIVFDGFLLGFNPFIETAVFSAIWVTVIFVVMLLLLRWVYILPIKYKDVSKGIGLAMVAGFVGPFLIIIPLVFGGYIFWGMDFGLQWLDIVMSIIYVWLPVWFSILVWYSLIVPYFRNIFRRPSIRELTVMEIRRRWQILLMIVTILVWIAALVIILYGHQLQIIDYIF